MTTSYAGLGSGERQSRFGESGVAEPFVVTGTVEW
jgi:hypothetical protein